MSDLKPEIHLMTPVPMRTADEQWQIAGYQCGVYATLDHEGLVFVDGKGGRACMRQDEWTAYQVKCLQGAPSISMMVVETEGDAELLSATRLRPNSDFARSFREIEQCLMAHTRCIHDDERDEIIRQIAAKIMPLKEAVLRAEEIWLEDHAPVRVTVNGHQLSRLDEIIEPDTNEELQLTNRGGCLVATFKAEDHEAEWLLDEQGKFSTEGGAA